jgi:hypothetical protein
MEKVTMVVVRCNRSSRYPAATVERLTKNYPHIPQEVVDSEHDVAFQARDALIAAVRKFIATA